jgi:serine/threonine-protein kinase
VTVTFSDLVAAKLIVQLGWRPAREVALELDALDRDPLAPPYLEGLRAARVLDLARSQKIARYVTRYEDVRRAALVAGILERSSKLPRAEIETWKNRLDSEPALYRQSLAALLREAGRIDVATEQHLAIEQERMTARENDRILGRYRREKFEGVDRPLTRDPTARIETGVFTIRQLFRSPESQRLAANPSTMRLHPGLIDRTAQFDTRAAQAALSEAELNPPAPSPVEGVPSRIGDYIVERTIGVGGMGLVVLAKKPSEPKSVAIKVARGRGREVTERFRREVLATSLVRHGNVVRKLGSGFLADETPYMVLEYVAGRELREILKEKTRLPSREAVSIFVQLLAALEAAHAAGVIHRDVKPENVLVAEFAGMSLAKLMDFGLARIDKDTAEVKEEVFQTIATNVVSGSPPYLAPEQILGEPIDRRTDLYAAGVVFYEMLTGSLPFTASTIAGYVRAHVARPAPRLSERFPDGGFPEPLETLVASLLTKKADERPSDARAVITQIENSVLPALTLSAELSATAIEGLPPPERPSGEARGITRILARLQPKKPEEEGS